MKKQGVNNVKTYKFKNNKEITSYNYKLYGDFRKEHLNYMQTVSLKDIRIIEPIHIGGLMKNIMHKDTLKDTVNKYQNENLKVERPLVVQEDKKNNIYYLIIGWKDFMLARKLEQEYVNTIIVDSDRLQFKINLGCIKPYNLIGLDDIKIQKKFNENNIHKEKIQAIDTYYKKYKQPYKPIVLNHANVLIDGFAQYVYNKNNGIEECQIQYINRS